MSEDSGWECPRCDLTTHLAKCPVCGLSELVTDEPPSPRSTQVGGDHYRTMEIQPWDVIDAVFTKEQRVGYYLGTVLSYLMRVNADQPGKGGVLDIEKAQHVTAKLIEVMQEGAK